MKTVLVFSLLVVLIAAVIFESWPHWLVRHGSISCDGKPLEGAALYRSRHGDFFALMPDRTGGVPAVWISDRMLLRCNTSAFTPVVGMLFSREAEPSSQCALMWKGAGSQDVVPQHKVTDSYAEFPWGSCAMVRLNY
jgi:hypothetical protein